MTHQSTKARPLPRKLSPVRILSQAAVQKKKKKKNLPMGLNSPNTFSREDIGVGTLQLIKTQMDIKFSFLL